jgi:hypothetical protein
MCSAVFGLTRAADNIDYLQAYTGTEATLTAIGNGSLDTFNWDCAATFEGEDLAGTDVESHAVSGNDNAALDKACCEHCKNNDACDFWVREAYDSGLVNCWIKKGATTFSKNAERRGAQRPPLQRMLDPQSDKGCDDEDAPYTKDRNGCDGWSKLSATECQRKCLSNDAPAACGGINDKICHTASYQPATGLCHLHEKCTPLDKPGTAIHVKAPTQAPTPAPSADVQCKSWIMYQASTIDYLETADGKAPSSYAECVEMVADKGYPYFGWYPNTPLCGGITRENYADARNYRHVNGDNVMCSIGCRAYTAVSTDKTHTGHTSGRSSCAQKARDGKYAFYAWSGGASLCSMMTSDQFVASLQAKHTDSDTMICATGMF